MSRYSTIVILLDKVCNYQKLKLILFKQSATHHLPLCGHTSNLYPIQMITKTCVICSCDPTCKKHHFPYCTGSNGTAQVIPSGWLGTQQDADGRGVETLTHTNMISHAKHLGVGVVNK